MDRQMNQIFTRSIFYLTHEIKKPKQTNQQHTCKRIFTRKENQKMENKTQEKRTSINDNITHENLMK